MLVGMNVLGRLLMELREQLKRGNGENLQRVEPVPIADFLLYQEPISVVQAWRLTGEKLSDPDVTPPADTLWEKVEETPVEANSTESIISADQIEHAVVESPTTVEHLEPVLPTDSDTCFIRCLPLLLQCLQREEPGEKQLGRIAESLDVLPTQLKMCIKRGIERGQIQKTKKKGKLVYLPLTLKHDPTLFDHGGDTS